MIHSQIASDTRVYTQAHKCVYRVPPHVHNHVHKHVHKHEHKHEHTVPVLICNEQFFTSNCNTFKYTGRTTHSTSKHAALVNNHTWCRIIWLIIMRIMTWQGSIRAGDVDHCFSCFFSVLYLMVLNQCKAHWVCLVDEMCSINKTELNWIFKKWFTLTKLVCFAIERKVQRELRWPRSVKI